MRKVEFYEVNASELEELVKENASRGNVTNVMLAGDEKVDLDVYYLDGHFGVAYSDGTITCDECGDDDFSRMLDTSSNIVYYVSEKVIGKGFYKISKVA